ncbi:MAG: hypothetical protein KME18_16800 [Phormidium tanganyikae FI6-MK23]|jgi:predicted transcriptional regulator of viral defense system|nr:hypothetical protein [Phormidium tanganyikae FI6-MK23]
MKHPSEQQSRVFAAIRDSEWFTVAAIAATASVSPNTVSRFIKLLDSVNAVDRVDRHPAPLFMLNRERFESSVKNTYFSKLLKLVDTLAI